MRLCDICDTLADTPYIYVGFGDAAAENGFMIGKSRENWPQGRRHESELAFSLGFAITLSGCVSDGYKEFYQEAPGLTPQRLTLR